MAGHHNPIHGLERTHWYERSWVQAVLAAIPAVVAAAVAAVDAYPGGRYLMLGFSGAWLFFGQVFLILSSHRKDKKDELDRSHDGLRACAFVLHKTVLEALLRESDEDPGLRVTIHRVVPPMNDPQHIEQVIPYVGGDSAGEGRLFSLRSGITGCAIRELSPFVMDRQSASETEYRKELVSEWHYTEADAKRSSMDKFSGMAVPVKDSTGQKAVAVVYLDSSRKGAFSNGGIAQLVVDACGGVTAYVGARYG